MWTQNGLIWLNPWLYLESIRPTCRGPVRVYWGLRFISVVGTQRTGGKMATALSRSAALAVARSISSSSKTVIPSLTAAMATNSRRASPLILRWRDHSFFLHEKILAFFRLLPQISWLFQINCFDFVEKYGVFDASTQRRRLRPSQILYRRRFLLLELALSRYKLCIFPKFFILFLK